MKKLILILASIFMSSCSTDSNWTILFDGETVKGLRGYRQSGMPDSWEIIDGTLKTKPDHGIDLISEEVYKTFENGKFLLVVIVVSFILQLKKVNIFGKQLLRCKY